MRISDITSAIERIAPLDFQESYDNAGIQVGISDEDVYGVLVCLDVTEAVVDEAIERGCNLIVSHHPLIFSPLKHLTSATYQERCVIKALMNGISIYSAHTNLDNAPGGVNYKIAELIGLKDVEWIEPMKGAEAGSGLIGTLACPEDSASFVNRIKGIFGVESLSHTRFLPGRKLYRVALCGGAGSFLMSAAAAKGADCFITGEMSYHHYFDSDGMLLIAMGHYQSEQFTCELLRDIMVSEYPELRVEITRINTNPIQYTV